MTREDILPVELAIRVEGIGKRYGSTRSRRRLPGFIESRRQRLDSSVGDTVDEDDLEADETDHDDEVEQPASASWVLRGISFDVPRGSSVALVGESGSGKTTLIRVLARITPPTEGKALVRGRVIPLVEVAANLLQPELTVRSNIIGLARLFGVPRDVARSHVADVAMFAELDGKLDSVARRLSAGQLRRLTVATALCLDADVILADEMIAGGEHAFAERALERLSSERARGTTLLLATQDLDLARRACDLAVHLRKGELVDFGPVEQVLDCFERSTVEGASARSHDDGDVSIDGASVLNAGESVDELRNGDDLWVGLELSARKAGTVVRSSVTFSIEGEEILRIAHAEGFRVDETGSFLVTARVLAEEFEGALPSGAEIEALVRCAVAQDGKRIVTTVRRRFGFQTVRRGGLGNDDGGLEDSGIDELGIADETFLGRVGDVTDAEWRVERI